MNLWMQFNAIASIILMLLLIAGLIMDFWNRMHGKKDEVW